MNKTVLLALVAVVAAIGVTVFNVGVQRALVVAIHRIVTLKYEYVNAPEVRNGLSAGAYAFERMLRNAPISADTLEQIRGAMDAFDSFSPLPSTTRVEPVNLRPGVTGHWVTPAGVDGDKGPVVLYLHGGGYIAGSPKGYLGFVSEIASRVNGRGFMLDYRLAPESPLPGAVEDAVVAYKYLVNEKKVDPKRLAVMGDSAGGGLTLLTLLALQEEENRHLPIPAAAVTFSAWTDLVTVPGGLAPYVTLKDADAMLKPEGLEGYAAMATGTEVKDYAKRKSPKISPLHAPLEGARFPPLLLQVGTAEILYDDSKLFYENATRANLNVKLQEGKGMQHIWPFFSQFFEEADTALQHATDFVVHHMPK